VEGGNGEAKDAVQYVVSCLAYAGWRLSIGFWVEGENTMVSSALGDQLPMKNFIIFLKQ